MRERDVARPQPRREAVCRIVGDADRVVRRFEADDGEHRSEDFFARDRLLGRHGVEHRRLDVKAACIDARLMSAERQARAFALRSLDVLERRLHLSGADHRAAVGLRLERIGGVDFLRDGEQFFDELICEAFLHQKAGAGGAHLPGIVENSPRGFGGGAPHIRAIIEDDVRRLAAEFEADALQIALSRILHQQLADGAGAGERQHVDVIVQGQRFSGGAAESRHDIEHAGRQAGFERELAELQRRQRALFRRLQNDGVAHRQRRRDLPHRHQQREIPRHDCADDAERLVHRERQAILRLGTDFAVNLVERFGVIAQALRRLRNVAAQRVGDRFADIEAFEQRQLFDVALHQLGELVEHCLFGAVVHLAPAAVLEGGARRLHCEVNIGLVAFGDGVQHAAVARSHVVESLAGKALAELAVDDGKAGEFDGARQRLEMRK